MDKRLSRRRFLGRGLKVSAGAGLTKVIGSSGTPKVVNWAKAIRDLILKDYDRWMGNAARMGHVGSVPARVEYMSYVRKFIAEIQQHTTLEIFVKLRGVGYMPMEYDIWLDMGQEYWDSFAKYLADYAQYIR